MSAIAPVGSVVTLTTPGFAAAAAAYGTLLGAPRVQADAQCQWQIGTTRLVVGAGDDRSAVLVPAVDLVDPQSADAYSGAGALLARRARPVVPVEPIAGARAAVVDGLPVGIVDTAAIAPVEPGLIGDIVGVDHIVMTSASRAQALALFGAVLGFDFRLEQEFSLPKGGRVHQLFLRGAGTIVEVLVDDKAGSDIALWGLAWTSGDIAASHARLVTAGVGLSDIRDGHKPGTRVFTIREEGVVVPTIVIGHGG